MLPQSNEFGTDETAPAPQVGLLGSQGGGTGALTLQHPQGEDPTLLPRSTQADTVKNAPETLLPGTLVDRFQVRRLLGSGGMGSVYLASDTVLGRQVALKVLRADTWLTHRGAKELSQYAERLLDEARATATFNHPNIIHIYHAGTFGGAPYLALEYVAGETLADRLKQRRFSPMETVRVGLALASALAESHTFGILHRDLKPGNVMVGTDGRVRVLDFGMALWVSDLRRSVTNADDQDEEGLVSAALPEVFGGTPAYMAPELWKGEPPTEASDLWALGVIVYELLAGFHPFRTPEHTPEELVGTLRAAPPLPRDIQVPESLSDLVRSCLSVNPRERPSARDVELVFAGMLAKTPLPSTDESPFRGLSAFDERHVHLFFGRDDDIASFLEHLRDHVVVPVVGASGSGKSSLVFAGVLPRLLEQDAWFVLRLRPGDDPLTALAKRLAYAQGTLALEDSETGGTAAQQRLGVMSPPAVETQAVFGLMEKLRTTPTLLGLWLQQVAEQRRSRVLLVVDGLEEVFTTGPENAGRRAFLEALCSVDPDPALSYRVLFTLREDFLGRFAAFGFARRVVGGMVMVTTPDGVALEKMVRAPLELLGYRFDDPELPRDMVRQIEHEPNALPLLQYAAQQLWERRDPIRKLLLRQVYEDMGGVAGALAKQADGILASLSNDEVEIARVLLLRLVTSQGTRATLSQARAIDGLGTAAEGVVTRLVDARLLSSRRVGEQHLSARLELAHEALIQSWQTLARWIAESREGVVALAEVTQAAEVWERRGRANEFVWSGAGLEELIRKVNLSSLKLPDVVREFLDTSLIRQRRRQRIRRVIVGTGVLVLAAVTVISSLVAAVINQEKRTAQQQRDEAERQREIVIEQSERIDKAQRDVGRFRLVLTPFDWDPALQMATVVPASQLDRLSWALFEPDRADTDEPGAAISADRVVSTTEVPVPASTSRVDWVETAGGPRFLRIEGRGRQGESCPPTWIRLKWLPGYADVQEGHNHEIEIHFPTCAATFAGMVEVPAGRMWSGVVKAERAVETAGGEDGGGFRERFVDGFWMDRTEVTRASYTQFGKHAALTGHPLPNLPRIGEYRGADGPTYPVTFVDWAEARAYCRFWGKDLPTVEQWEKAARGGITLDSEGQLYNPLPKRRYPWGDEPVDGRANLKIVDDGFAVQAPAVAFDHVPGPYGTLNQTGNVSEWALDSAVDEDTNELRALLGGDWTTDASRSWGEIGQINTRNPRALNYSTGFRCAVPVE